MSWPAEAVPDGAAFAPHHLTWGALIALLVVFVVADDYARREPLFALVGLTLALFGFLFVWPYYPVTGAALTLAGVTCALGGVLWPGGIWAAYPLRWRLVAVLGVLVALDDAVSHTFGVWTPLDGIWGGIHHVFP